MTKNGIERNWYIIEKCKAKKGGKTIFISVLPISISFLFFLFEDNHLQKNNFMINDYVPENFCAQHFASYYFFFIYHSCACRMIIHWVFAIHFFFVCFSIYLCLLAIALLAMKKIITLLKLHSCCRSALSSTSYPFFSRSFFFLLRKL